MSTSEPSEGAVLKVVEEFCHQLNPQQTRVVNLSSHLEWDLGIGSLERAELIRRLERELGQSLPSQPLFAAPRVRDLVAVVNDPASVIQLSPCTPGPCLAAPLPAFPETAQTVLEALQYQCQAQPERLLYYFEEEGVLSRSLTPLELWRECAEMAGSLESLGVGPGQTVALMLPTGLHFVAAFLAIQWLGAVPVPLYPPFRADQAEDYLKRQCAIMDNARVRLLVSFDRAWSVTQLLQVQSQSLEQVVSAESLAGGTAALPRAVQGDSLGLIQYTSGSTGSPKGVALSHANLLHNIRAYGQALQPGNSDVCVSWLPLYHDMGLIGAMLGSIYHGIPLVLMGPQDFLARPARWLQAMSRYRGTISPAPNFAFEICARKVPDDELTGLDLSPWRVALNGAEAVQPETLSRFSQRFEGMGFKPQAHFPCYGLAEAALAVAFSPLNRGAHLDLIDPDILQTQAQAVPHAQGQAWVSCGKPLMGTELSVRNPQGQELPERHQGRLFFRSGSALQEYYRNPQATAEIKSPEGWVDTGDLAYIAEGELYITGRAKDLIIKAGRNLYPQDIEAAVGDVDGVRRGCVAAFPVPALNGVGEQLVVAFETRQKSDDLIARVGQAVTRAVGVGPDQVLALAPGSIPKTPSGKIRRSECARLLQMGRLGYKPGKLKQGLALLRQMPIKNSLRGAYTGLALFGVVGLPALVIARFHGSLARRLMQPAGWLALRMLGLKLKIRGMPHPGPCIFVTNHGSLLDPITLIAATPRPLLFLVAPWIYQHPILKSPLRNMGHLKASRGEVGGAPRLAQEILEVIHRGQSLACFPEGGLETSPGLREFNLGVFQVAAEHGLTVQPVVLRGTRRSMPWPRLVPQPTTLEIEFGPCLTAPDQDLSGAVELARLSRVWLAEQCGEPLLQQRLRRER